MQLKDFVSITAALINRMRGSQTKITDFNVGSVARTMLEAPAAEMEELYQQMFIGLREAIPVAVYNAFDFERLPAQKATGILRYTVTSSTTQRVVSTGSIFKRPGTSKRFAVQQDVIIPPGSTFVDVPVAAESGGLLPPIPAGATFEPDAAGDGYISAVALAAFYQGADEETLDQQKARFKAFIDSLHRGTRPAIEYGIDTFGIIYNAFGGIAERAAFREIDEPWMTDNNQPPGLINIYIHNGVSGASGDLITRVQEVVDGYYDASGNPVPGYKAAGTKAVVTAATSVLVDVTGVVVVDEFFDGPAVRAAVSAAITQYLSLLPIGGDVLRSEIYAAAMAVEGVVDFTPSLPASNTVIAFNAKALPGTITVT